MSDAGDVFGVGGVAAYRELLRNRSFRNLFFAMLSSSLGDWIGVLAILALTKSILGPTRAAAFALSGVMMARVLPTLLLGPVAGVFVDRWDRKRTLIATDIGRGVVMGLIPFANDVFALFLATLVIETMSTIFIPAKDAVLPGLVRRGQLVEANQLSLGVTYGTLPLGGALFALLVGAATTFFSGWELLSERPAALPIWINALSFFASAGFIARLHTQPRPRGERRRGASTGAATAGAWQELKEGFRFIATQPLVRALVAGIMAAFLAAGVVIAVGELFAGVLNAGSSGFGVLVAVVGAGLLGGLAASGPLTRRIDKERLFAPGTGVAGAALIVTALMPRVDLAAIPAFVMGFSAGIAFIAAYTMLQERSSDDIRGRTFAAFNTGVRIALFVSLVVGPALVGLIGPEGTQLLDGTRFTPYQIGGVRVTLMAAGAIALAGGVWTGRAVHQVLSARNGLRLTGQRTAATVAPPREGLFVVFEGGEGAGKSTQIRLLRAAVERLGCEAVTTREPGGTAIGERIRELLLDVDAAEMGDRAEALLYAAARAQHADEVIRPALEKGAVVLCDRYVDSSIVYQGVGRGLGDHQIEELSRWGTDDLQPDLVVLLDVDAEEGLRRAGGTPDRLEAAGLPFHERVNEAFRRQAAKDPPRYLVLDASRPVEEIHAEVRDAVFARLRREVEG